MAGPWEKYQSQDDQGSSSAKPWEKYGKPKAPVEPAAAAAAPNVAAAPQEKPLPGYLQPFANIPKDIAEDFEKGSEKVRRAMPKEGPLGGFGKPLVSLSGWSDRAFSPITGTARALIGDPARAVIPQNNMAGRVAANMLQMGAEMVGPGELMKAGKAGYELAAPFARQAGQALSDAPAAALRGAVASAPRKGAEEAINQGVALTPRMAQEKPTLLSSAASGLGGAVKLEREASAANQAWTNASAAKAMGLPVGKDITADALKGIRTKAGAAYEAPKEVLPSLRASQDPQFVSEINAAAQRQGELQGRYPTATATNPKIVALQKELTEAERMSASDAIELTKRYRADASTNLKSWDDPDKRELGLFQRKAADALEQMVGRNLQNAPQRLRSEMTALQKERVELAQKIEKEQNVISRQTRQEGYESLVGDPEAKKAALKESEANVRKMKARLSEIGSIGDRPTGEMADIAAKMKRVEELGPAKVSAMLQDWQQSRKTIAMSHTVESALNEDTGEVSAKALAAMKNRGVPLSGELDQIATAYNRFSKVFQSPAKFGYPEKFSYFDAIPAAVGGIGALAGHPEALGAMALPAARPLARSMLLSPRYQKAMIGQ